MNRPLNTDPGDENDIARLLSATGRRIEPSADAMAEARAAVEAEWRDVVAARQRRNRLGGWAMAAGLAVAGVAVWLARPMYLPASGPVATVARVVGGAQADTGDGRWAPLAAGAAVTSSTTIRTGSGGRVALAMRDGVQLRLDADTQLAFAAADEASLARGAVYVDSGSGAGAPAARFTLETPAGDVRHLGTQYEARYLDGSLQVGVREGRVEVTGAAGTALAGVGEQITVRDGQVSRAPLARTASAWDWVGGVTPPFSINGRSVDDFLAWAGRESGRTIVYASADVERQARQVTLSGTVEGLAPEQAVTAVLSTTSLEPTLEGDRIRIDTAGR